MTESADTLPANASRDRVLRDQLLALLRGDEAHTTFGEAVADFPDAQINVRPPNVEYTFWHLIEHLRITQADILDYLTKADYEEREWPREYWPARDAEASRDEWDASVASFQRDLAAIATLVTDEESDLFAPVPSNDRHTVLREILIVADHNAYHVGELGILRQVAGAWGRAHTE